MCTEIMCADRYGEMFTNLEAAKFTSPFISSDVQLGAWKTLVCTDNKKIQQILKFLKH